MPTTSTIVRPTHADGDEIDASMYNSETVVSVTVPDATTSAEGVVRLAGDLEGTGAAPVIKASLLTTFMRTVTAAVSAVAARAALGLGDSAVKNTGSAAGTVCAGDDSRLADDRRCNNTFANAATSRTALGLGDSAVRNIGDVSGTVCRGDDARLYDLRHSLPHTHVPGDVTGLGALAVKSSVNNSDWSGVALSLGNGGLGATTVLAQQAVWGLHDGVNLHATPNGLTLADADAAVQQFIGQDSTHALVLQWAYNAVPGVAYGLISTYGRSNPLLFQAKDYRIDTASLDFAVQIFAGGDVRIGGGADDGAALQVAGNLSVSGTLSVAGGPIPIASGGTGAATVVGALASLGLFQSILNSDLAASMAVSQAGAAGVDLVFNVAGAPTVTLTAGTWFLTGAVQMNTQVTGDGMHARFYNSTDAVNFGGSAGKYSDTTQIDTMAVTGVITVASGSKVIYFRGFRYKGTTELLMGYTVAAAQAPAGWIQAIRMY